MGEESSGHLSAAARSRLGSDLDVALGMLTRAEWVREFVLAGGGEADVALLLSSTGMDAAFTIVTEEEQRGELAGTLALTYLVVPAFVGVDGLSGGCVVTTYENRDHPLHSPSVMGDVRVGRYVRDEKTGEWCILTRNQEDRLTRLQYLKYTGCTERERICLTCNSDLFDAGLYAASVLFECHDREFRPCPSCGAPAEARCACSALTVMVPGKGGLESVVAGVLREGSASWAGTVRVTVVSNLVKNRLLDIDTCMQVRSLYAPKLDAVLASQLQRLALSENYTMSPRPPVVLGKFVDTTCVYDDPDADMMDAVHDSRGAEFATDANESKLIDITESEADPYQMQPFSTASLYEAVMMPADPSTLPAGIELCMDGMLATDSSSPSAEQPESSADFSRTQPAYEQRSVPPIATRASAHAPVVLSTKLTPRPPGMSAGEDGGWVWQMGAQSCNAMAVAAAAAAAAARAEKERRAEERRKKNRIAAARSNARTKANLDSIKAEMRGNRTRASELAKRLEKLRAENKKLRAGRAPNAMDRPVVS